jgi:hypothetical protein
MVLDGKEDWLRERFIRHRRNADVVRQELIAETGIAVSLKTLQRAVHPFRQALKAEALPNLLHATCMLTRSCYRARVRTAQGFSGIAALCSRKNRRRGAGSRSWRARSALT